MTPETLILFDIDGTLLRAAGSGKIATERAMREVFGTVGGLADYRFSGKTDWFTLIHLLKPEGFTEMQIEAALPDYHSAMGKHMAEIIADYPVTALPGTLDLVNTLRIRPDVLVGLLTGNVPQVADLKLRAAGFSPEDFMISVYGSESPMRRQLVPLALARAERHCGVQFATSSVVIIGDTLDDIDCAHSIEARVIAVATGNVPRAQLEQHPPVTVLDDLSDQAVVLQAILGKAN